MNAISAVLITLNAEAHLSRVLKSLPVCSEIIILDSGSTDQSRAIASEYGAQWYEHPFDAYGAQKVRANKLAANDWILSLDADEVLDNDAIQSIENIDWDQAHPEVCWRIRRRPFVGASEVRHGHWVPDRIIRLFNRRFHNFCTHPVHPTVEPSATVYDLKGSIKHYCYNDMADVFRTDYHRLKARHYNDIGRRASGPMLAFRAYWAFTYSYVIRRGFLDGRLGVITATAGALNAILGLALASEIDSKSTTNRRS